MNPAKTCFAIGAILAGLASPAFAQGISAGTQTRGSAQGSVGVGPGINSTLGGSAGVGGQVSAPGANVGVDGSASSSDSIGIKKKGGAVSAGGSVGGGVSTQLGR